MKAKPKTETSKLKSLLAKASSKWKEAAPPAQTGGMVNESVPDGSYEAVLTKAYFAEQADKACAIMEYTIGDSAAEAAGEIVKNRYWLDTAESQGWLKRDLTRFGYDDLDTIEDMETEVGAIFEEIVAAEPIVKIMIRTKNDFQNVYMNKVIEMAEPTGEPVEPPPEKPAAKPTKPAAKPAAKAAPAPAATKPKAKPKADVEEEIEDEVEVEVEEEEPAAEEEFAEIEVGTKVVALFKGKEEPGTVKEVDEEAETVVVKLDSGKTVKVSVDKVEIAA